MAKKAAKARRGGRTGGHAGEGRRATRGGAGGRGAPGRRLPARKAGGGKVTARAPAAAPVKRREVDRNASPTALAIASAGLDKKAEDVLVIDVRGLTSYADFFVLMTADSDRQASAIADHVEQTMKTAGVSKVGVEGYETGRWILVDYGDVVAHVMNRDSRQFYDLESLWADAPRFRVEA